MPAVLQRSPTASPISPSETDRRIYALDVESGEELWHFDIDGDVMCCLGVGNGLVMVPTMSGSLYAIGGDGVAIKP